MIFNRGIQKNNKSLEEYRAQIKTLFNQMETNAFNDEL